MRSFTSDSELRLVHILLHKSRLEIYSSELKGASDTQTEVKRKHSSWLQAVLTHMCTVTKRLLAENCLLNNYPMLVSCSRSQRTRYRQIPPNTKQFKAPFHNITSSDAHQLTAVLVDIVNDRDQFKANKMFYQQLHNSQENKPDDEV